jgi:Uma2 family endonuclease
MMATKTITVPVPDDHTDPAWEVALLFPAQGEWSEDDYLWLTDHTKRLVELTDGHIEVLPMPTEEHQRIVLYLYRALYVFLGVRGIVLVAPLRLRLQTGRYREPDLLLLLSTNDTRRGNQFWTGADLVLEVVSPDDPGRDLVQKHREYAEAGISEYWIVDPSTAQMTVLRLEGTAYLEHGVFPRSTQATSVLLDGFSVAVDSVLDAV